MFTTELIQQLPKSDLHLHLDGSLRLDSLIEMAKSSKVDLPSYTEEGLREEVFKESYRDLGEYLHGFMYTCSVLRSLENLERVSYELAKDNQQEGVFYIEVRFAPQLLIDLKGVTMEGSLTAVNRGLERATKEFNQQKSVVSGEMPPFNYGIIVCAMRMFSSAFSPYYTKFFSLHHYSDSIDVIKMGAVELARAAIKIRDEKGIPIVGFDLAGQEDGYPAEDFKKAYALVHKNFMHKTVHAGEAYGAESIFQAITELYADRIGHCYYLFDTDKITDTHIVDKEKYVSDLASYIAEKRITVELCLTSNMQTNPAIKKISDHSFKEMLKQNVSITICTDNRLVSNTTVTKEIELAVNNFTITPKILRNLIVYGFKRSFYPGNYRDKRIYTRKILNYYDKIARKHQIDIE
ncbi:MAG: adenosine deaminase family protein [Bdellovibrionales bacterium]|jgi:adenosine deaminase|nr:adenosine deaminase family protein [Bdellovibrionales bacterium]MBT3525718.1 adenosine deaminase family protein [Bdellovibrionales bacterium]MBT7667960.1 adenosine deaminase family protein [Bdellovibrionales bacterium]MBT7766201.1 adenosine deaminase family protein [Bdellovibrionales bacterium]